MSDEQCGSVRSLQDLGPIARRLTERRAQAQAEERARREAVARVQAERHLFAQAVGPVTPLAPRNPARQQPSLPAPIPVQQQRDEQRALQESMSDEFDVSTLLDTDDTLSFRRPGVGPDVTRKLRAGHWSIQRQLDLHGLRTDEAREALGAFLRDARRTGLRCVRVVHGKGLGSPGRTPVLKTRVQRWLVQKNEVLAFVQARPAEGGAGALVVLLRPGLR
ncbi:Smr/MutS family protein [Ramlibacter sp. H39-3-26]|uniref:Smr/MutS family protein n=1 Tax=Curvibacter soli TaxID=3031331 RepID=UPI0023DCBE40|nr:Smr/MutS family protein [Ramlibacter sp. H39-3-26]MDF1484646.1 Smr/MutS family protein [Ramlibacter sp. H39-3-26]